MWENPADLYGQQLDALQRQLDSYRQERTPANEIALGQRLRVITDVGQAPELVQAVRREFSQPNAYVDVSTTPGCRRSRADQSHRAHYRQYSRHADPRHGPHDRLGRRLDDSVGRSRRVGIYFPRQLTGHKTSATMVRR